MNNLFFDTSIKQHVGATHPIIKATKQKYDKSKQQ